MIGGSTPSRLQERSALYRQLGGLLAAGSGLLESLQTLHAAPPASAFRAPLGRVVRSLERGTTFSEALARLGGQVPDLDLALLRAGERSGTLERSVRLLAEYYDDQSRLLRRLLSGLAYPAVIVQLALLLFPLDLLTEALWHGAGWRYLAAKLLLCGGLYGVVLLIIYAIGTRRPPMVRATVERLLATVPLLGGIRRPFLWARVSTVLAMLVKAGISPADAWDLAGRASGSPALAGAVAGAVRRVHAGQAPGDAIASLPGIPSEMVRLYRTAERTGTLDETLAGLAREYREAAANRLSALARWVPRVIYLAVLLAVGYRLIASQLPSSG